MGSICGDVSNCSVQSKEGLGEAADVLFGAIKDVVWDLR